MLHKILEFIEAPLPRKIFIFKSFIIYRPIYLVEKLLVIFVKIFFFTRFGRRLLFLAHPKNDLLIVRTKQGVLFIVNSSDRVIGKSVYETKIAFDSKHLINALKILNLDQDATLFDIGANIGTVGCNAVKLGIIRRCIAFEPDPDNFSLLKYNIALNGLDNDVIPFNVALSNENSSTLKFEKSNSNFGDHRVLSSIQTGKVVSKKTVISVQARMLDSYLEYLVADKSVVFMDTQGFEANILSGSSKFISKKVPLVVSFCPYSLMRYDAFELFLNALEGAPYCHIVDLQEPNRILSFERATFLEIFSRLGTGGNNTDLVLF